MSWVTDYYLWIKSFHLLSVISWMVGLLYLPRLFVYHNEVSPTSEVSKTFLIMERRLLKYIMLPAMIASYLTGLLMLMTFKDNFATQGWLHVKLLSVFALTILHHFMKVWYKEFLKGQRKHSTLFFRLANEVPTIVMIVVVIMAIVQPF